VPVRAGLSVCVGLCVTKRCIFFGEEEEKKKKIFFFFFFSLKNSKIPIKFQKTIFQRFFQKNIPSKKNFPINIFSLNLYHEFFK